MKQISLTGRILATVIGGQLLLVAGLTTAAVLYGREQLGKAFDAALDGRAMATLALVRYSETQPTELVFDPDLLPPSADPIHKDLFEIRRGNQQILAHSDPVPPVADPDGGRYVDFLLNGVPYRAVVFRQVQVLDEEEDNSGPPAKVHIVYAASVLEVRTQLRELGFSVAGMSLLLLVFTSGFVIWGLHRRLRPLRDLAASAESISVRNWTFRPPQAAKRTKELLPLATALETLVSRLETAFRQQSDFTSDAAHELKTAVAIIKSTVESLLQRDRSAEEYHDGVRRLQDDCHRLEDLLDRMLRLARVEQWAETGLPASVGVTELASTCETALARIQPLATARNTTIEFITSSPVYVRAEPADLELIWVNLLENALQYSPAGSQIVLRIENGGGNVRIFVEDSGPGISPDQIERIFERFRRADPSRARRTGGFGLGLAICKALAEAYGGTIRAVNRATGGTEFRVQLPTEAS
jgi:signal transduction histidine kinase